MAAIHCLVHLRSFHNVNFAYNSVSQPGVQRASADGTGGIRPYGLTRRGTRPQERLETTNLQLLFENLGTLVVRLNSRSFKKKNGVRTEPCGTPLVTH